MGVNPPYKTFTQGNASLDNFSWYPVPPRELLVRCLDNPSEFLTALMHLSIEIPTHPPPPPPGQGGGMWGIFVVFEGTVRPWGWGISQDLLWTLGIGLVPSFLTVISSRGHWCRSLDLSRALQFCFDIWF